jgi:hypothetical protein
MPTVKSYNLVHGEIIDCIISGNTVRNGMVVITEDRYYLFQDYISGAVPDRFNEINEEFGTRYATSWSLGGLNATLDKDVSSINKTGRILRPVVFKQGEKYLDREGQLFVLDQYVKKAGVLIFKNKYGVLCKCIGMEEFRSNLIPESEFKPLTEEQIFNAFYAEDLFPQMIYKKATYGGFSDHVRESLRAGSLNATTAWTTHTIGTTTVGRRITNGPTEAITPEQQRVNDLRAEVDDLNRTYRMNDGLINSQRSDLAAIDGFINGAIGEDRRRWEAVRIDTQASLTAYLDRRAELAEMVRDANRRLSRAITIEALPRTIESERRQIRDLEDRLALGETELNRLVLDRAGLTEGTVAFRSNRQHIRNQEELQSNRRNRMVGIQRSLDAHLELAIEQAGLQQPNPVADNTEVPRPGIDTQTFMFPTPEMIVDHINAVPTIPTATHNIGRAIPDDWFAEFMEHNITTNGVPNPWREEV